MILLNFFNTVGITALPLLLLSLVSVTLILERVIFWVQIKRQQLTVIRYFISLYKSDPEAAIIRLRKNKNLPIVRILLEALQIDSPTPEEFRLALESAAQAEIPLLKRFNTVFETIISVAPLLGLLGTILGLIKTFAALNLGEGNTTGSQAVTGGISEALWSTVLGLVVAIFTLLFANTFRGFYQRQIALIQEYGGQLELLYRRRFYQ